MTNLLAPLACLSAFVHVASALLVNSSSNNIRINLRGRASAHQALERGACGKTPSFLQYVSMYDRSYSDEEYATRRSLFERRVADIEAQNCRSDRLWHATVNLNTDRTDEELAAMRGRSRAGSSSFEGSVQNSLLQTTKKRSPMSSDTSVDYRHMKLKAMMTIRNQGACGSCWAQGTVAVLWAHKQIYNGDDTPFSIQQLVDCVPNPDACGGTGGCQGATAELALHYVEGNGLATESEYQASGGCPAAYKAKDANPIPQPSSDNGTVPGGFGMIGWEKLAENQQEPLMRAVYEMGPVAVSVAAGGSWDGYGGGIMNSCPKDGIINHLVVLVGFGHEGGKDYWNIQNSWGSGWGESGFMRILRQQNQSAHCGWDHSPDQGTACKGGPSKVWICGMCGILYDSAVPHFAGKTKEALMMYQRRIE